MPEDVDPAIKEEFESDRLNQYSPSWFLVSELLAANYDQEIESRGWASPDGRVEAGTRMTLRRALGGWYFEFLAELDPACRFVFWFS